MEKLCEFWVSPGFLTEKMHLYVASDLTATKQDLEDDELLTVERFSLDRLGDMVLDGEIEDAKTIIGISMTLSRLRG